MGLITNDKDDDCWLKIVKLANVGCRLPEGGSVARVE